MKRNAFFFAAIAAGICFGGLGGSDVVRADNMFETMNPFNWFFDDDDDDDDYYYGRGGPYGRSGPYGWGGPWEQYGYRDTQMVIVLPENNTVDSQVALPE
jgi:hypothetical protein